MSTTTTETTKPHGRIRIETGAKRLRAYLGGEVVADTTRPVLVWEVPYYPTYYFPLADVRAEFLERTAALRTPRAAATGARSPSGPGARRCQAQPCDTKTRRSRSCAT